MATKTNKPKYMKIDLDLTTGPLSLYASPRILEALDEVTGDMSLYKGVRLYDVLSAVYQQGLKDGRREVVEQLDSIKKSLNYLPPGRPRKKSKK